jgi:predicted DCC family thiol-disulfide oxidoreductase YuxK
MFQEIKRTNFPPLNKPLMVFDGNCGFCKYWIAKWKLMTGNLIDYQPYQEATKSIRDIDEIHFKQAVRFIDTEGMIKSGPEAAYYTYYIRGKSKFLFDWYKNKKWFKKLNDIVYQWIADNRSFVFNVCVKMLGSDPLKTQHFWLIYLLSLVCVTTLAIIMW